jgi:hypothetical protein
MGLQSWLYIPKRIKKMANQIVAGVISYDRSLKRPEPEIELAPFTTTTLVFDREDERVRVFFHDDKVFVGVFYNEEDGVDFYEVAPPVTLARHYHDAYVASVKAAIETMYSNMYYFDVSRGHLEFFRRTQGKLRCHAEMVTEVTPEGFTNNLHIYYGSHRADMTDFSDHGLQEAHEAILASVHNDLMQVIRGNRR